MTHTTGPWDVLDGIPDGGGIAIGPILPTVGHIAEVTYNGGNAEANARLIAAAPELLEALEQCARLLRIGNRNNMFAEAADRADVAITKAKGE